MFSITQPEEPTNSKAVVILYGWFGALPKHLGKYAELYAKQLSCIAIHGTISNSAVLFRIESEIISAATESVQKAAKVIRELETKTGKRLPVIVHYFSNGGAYVFEYLEQVIQTSKTDEFDGSVEEKEDFKLVAERMKTEGCEIADSSPVYMHTSSALGAIDVAVPSLPARITSKASFLYHVAKTNFAAKLAKKDIDAVKFWKNMQNNALCTRQAFIYSTKDHLTDPEKLESLIDERKKRGGKVSVLKFDDSDHVMHLKKHPKEYVGFLIQMMSA